jgi:hypothetical protein
MIHGLRHLRKDKLNFIHEPVQTLVEIMEAQNLKVTFFFDQERSEETGFIRRGRVHGHPLSLPSIPEGSQVEPKGG